MWTPADAILLIQIGKTHFEMLIVDETQRMQIAKPGFIHCYSPAQ
jgi:hypothetical protein